MISRKIINKTPKESVNKNKSLMIEKNKKNKMKLDFDNNNILDSYSVSKYKNKRDKLKSFSIINNAITFNKILTDNFDRVKKLHSLQRIKKKK